MSSPLEICIALHYWTTVGDYSPDNVEHANSSSVKDCLRRMKACGLLSSPGRDGANFGSTEALGVYVEALCKVNWPVMKWVIPPSVEG